MGKVQLDNFARWMAMVGVAFPLLLIVFFYHLGATSFLGFAFIGLTAIQLSIGPTLIELALTLAASSFYYAVYARFDGAFPHELTLRIAGVLSFLGTGSLLAMAARVLWGHGEAQRHRLRVLLVGLTPIVFLVYMPLVGRFLPASDPDSLDHFLYAFDSRFGLQISFLAGRWFAASGALRMICSLVYLGLPLAMAGVYLAVPEALEEPSLVRTFLLVGVVGVLLYRIVPAAGPAYSFPEYPDHAAAVGAGFLRPIRLQHPILNAIPSLHTAWALLIYWRARYRGWTLRAAGVVFLFLTLLATLGLGEHYLIDLVVGFPFAVAMRFACMTQAGWSRQRVSAMSINAALVFVWLVLLRQGSLVAIPAWCAWALAATTVGGALWSNRNLPACAVEYPIAQPRLAAD